MSSYITLLLNDFSVVRLAIQRIHMRVTGLFLRPKSTASDPCMVMHSLQHATQLCSIQRIVYQPGMNQPAAMNVRSIEAVQVMIWDDHEGRCIGELTFRNQVCLPRQ